MRFSLMKCWIRTGIAAALVLLVAAASNAASLRYLMQLPEKGVEVRLAGPIFTMPDFNRQRYYVCDAVGGKLVSFDAQGKFLAAFDAVEHLDHPVALARDAQENLWVAERSSNVLKYVDFKRKTVETYAAAYEDGRMMMLDRPAVDSRNRLYVLDRLSGSAARLNDRMKVETVFVVNKPEFKGIIDYKIKPDGIWALDGLDRKVYQFSDDGRVVKSISLSSDLQFPASIEVDRAGQIYILDRHAGMVVVFGQDGQIRYQAIGRGKLSGRLWYPAHLIFDWKERLCISDEGNRRVQIFER